MAGATFDRSCGSYAGERIASDRNGDFRNWRTASRYGVHKP
jgi:hypothetical protein